MTNVSGVFTTPMLVSVVNTATPNKGPTRHVVFTTIGDLII